MPKRSYIILSLVATVISLIYLMLSHFEVIRYISIKNADVESYSAKYSNLPRASDKKTVLAFTATEEQLKNLRPFIVSLLDQSVRADDIVAVLPYSLTGKVPEELKNVLSVRGYSKDYDDASALVSTVLSEPEADTKIILVEPYMVYGKFFVQTMAEKSDEEPSKIVYGNKKKGKAYGILVKPKFFDESICDYKKGMGCATWLNMCKKCGDTCADCENTYGVL
jgi:hypothetical protein